MALEIYWTKRADKNFDKIIDYLLNEWGENVSRAFVKKVYDFLDIPVYTHIQKLPGNNNGNIRPLVFALISDA